MGYGYATELSKLFLDFAFETLKLEKIVAVTFNGNASSEKVLKKIGMKNVGICSYGKFIVNKFEILRNVNLKDSK